MSGHSHFSTIRRKKEGKDAAKGQIFSKYARVIQLAVKSGGGPDPSANYKLRMAIEKARASNMPKENIERAISKGTSSSENLEEVFYEGFGPSGIGIIVEAVTNNRNRTSQEIKNIFERGGGSLAGPGSVSFQFEPKGNVVIKKETDSQKQMLDLIDIEGVEDVEEGEDAIDVYTSPDSVGRVRDNLMQKGYSLISIAIIKRPKSLITVDSKESATKVLNLLEKFEEQDDVQDVYANVDIPNEFLDKTSQ
ncbi:hypothetical protein A2159_03685 [Candidatus Woesebacteria bacterium RBG_13_34_9]|uniref:Probable transcriptional regulatory protein A2159_03685 n=1 Tax=Candidatus Woesebacteria bacterium RBG_13_34_9 TaxID=1802477 RepID=A0A1F7X140_9BACT|nr:MAG: hypothetical protein A2159_03685 [Candidatus Woesebacteria bacterium RBG_13_34_9]